MNTDNSVFTKMLLLYICVYKHIECFNFSCVFQLRIYFGHISKLEHLGAIICFKPIHYTFEYTINYVTKFQSIFTELFPSLL